MLDGYYQCQGVIIGVEYPAGWNRNRERRHRVVTSVCQSVWTMCSSPSASQGLVTDDSCVVVVVYHRFGEIAALALV